MAELWQQEQATGFGQIVRKFWQLLLKLLRSYFIAIGILTTFSFCMLLFALSQFDFSVSSSHEEVTQAEAVLVIDVSGELRRWKKTRRNRFWPRVALVTRDTWVSDVQRALELARTDESIKAVLLDMQESMRGRGVDFVALRDQIAAFVADSDKQVVCFLAAGDNRSYLVASAADSIVISPVTMLEIPGPILNLTYFGSAIKKLGIGVQVLQTGDYKSAFEPFVLDKPSAAVLEMYGDLEQSLRSLLVRDIAQGRQRQEGEVKAWLARSIYTADDAHALGLVDKVGYRLEALTDLKEWVAVEEQVSYRAYLKEAKKKETEAYRQGLGLVEARGPIFMDGNEWETLLPRRIIAELQWMYDNEDVLAVVLRVDSPGGSVLASELIWKEVSRLAAHKPVVVSMGEMAASGGYYLAVGASYLLAEQSTLTGSIGVVGMIPNFAGFKDEYGVSFHVVTASERRALYNAGEAMSTEDQRLVQDSLQEVYRIFKERVAAGRKLEIEQVEKLAGGRVFTGMQALDAGLVDALGGLDVAFAKAKALASLDTDERYPLYRYDHGRLSFLDCLRATFDFKRCFLEQQSHTRSPAATLRHYLRLFTANQTRLLALWPHLLK